MHQVISALSGVAVVGMGTIAVTEAIMEELNWSEQLSLVAQSDILIGMHGISPHMCSCFAIENAIKCRICP